MAKQNNSNILENDVLYIEGGLPFKFMRGVKDEELAKVKEWVETILKKLA